MTQERANNNSYAFVMEDPSKPRKYQLNFQLNDNHQYKEPTHIQQHMDQSLTPHNPQHHSLHHIDHNPLPRQPTQITLPSIKELMQIPPSPIPPPPSLPPSLPPTQRILQQQQQQQQQQQHQQQQQQHQQQQYLHHHHNNNIHSQHKTDSLTSLSRPHLPPLPDTPQNFNYPFNTTSRNDNRNERIDSHLQLSQHSQHSQQHSSHLLPQHTHQHPLMPSSTTEVSSYYSPHSYPSHSTNTQYPVNHKINQIPPPPQHHTHYQQQPPPQLPPHQPQRSPQVLPQRMSHQPHQSHHHHLLQPTQPQQQVPQAYHHHHPPPPPPSSHHHSHVYNNDIVPVERSQHDHQPSAVSAPPASRPYNSHYYPPQSSQVYSNPPIISAPSHVTPSHGRNVPPLTEYSAVRDASLNSEHHHLQQQQQNGISGHVQQYPPPQHPQVQHHQQPMYIQNHHHQQQQQQQQPPPQVSHLQVPPQNIPRPLTPPQLNLPPQLPQQIQNQFLPENRETSPFHLVPPSHHHSGSNSSVSTRSSSPAPSTPITSNNLPFSPNNGIPVNNTVPNNMDKPIEQNVSVKKKGRSKQLRTIVPAGPLPNQPNSSSQPLQTNTSNDPLVIVQYSNSSNNNTSTKAPQASRSRKNSISGGSAPFTSKRGRKAKDSSSSAMQTKVIEEVYNGNIPSASISVPENNEKYTAQNRKREYSSSSDSQNSKRYKKGEEVHVIHDDDDVMEDANHNEKEEEQKMDVDDEGVKLLLSLKSNNTNNVVENTFTVNKPMVEPVVNNKDIKIKEEHAVNKVFTPIDEPVINNDTDIKMEPVDQLVTKKVREMSIKEEEKQFYTQKKATPKSPKKSVGIVKPEVHEKNKFSFNRTFIQDKKERVNVGSDSDSDLAMDDGSEDEVDQNKQPERNLNIEGNVQCNSDDMETEEEVEEEIVISSLNRDSTIRTGTNGVAKEHVNNVNSSNVTDHRKSNEDVKEADASISANTSDKKLSQPESPISSCFTTINNGILSRKDSTSSSISRKGSTSSNGSNKEKDNVIYGSPIEAPIASPIPSPPSVKTAADAGNSNNTTTNGNTNSNSSNSKPQRPCPPRRRSTMRDDEKLELNAIEWEKNIEIPHEIWEETLRVFEIVKHSKEMKNRQPHRKRNHILASILFILCRQNGLPRTFVEICNAASIRKQEIGTYYRLMLKVFENNGLGDGSNGTVDSAEYLKRWCQNLKLPSHILNAAIHVFRQASELNITTGKCPVSVGAASIWLSIHSWNDIRSSTYSHTHTDDAELIKVEHKDVATAAGVVNATLVGCFKNLLKFKESLLPEGFLKEARERSPYYLKPNSINCVNNNSESDAYGRLSSSVDSVKSYASPKADNCDNSKSKGDTATVESKAEPKIEPASKPVKSEPVLKSPTKSQVKIERNETSTQSLKSPVKEAETSTNADKVPAIKKEEKNDRTSPILKTSPTVTKPTSEIESGQEDADDELEEGELREDDEDMMID